MAIDITTLGGLSIGDDGTEIPGFAGQPIRAALLVYLAVQRESTRDAVMAVLWPERAPRLARHALSQTLHELKNTLGADWLGTHGERLRVTDRVRTDAGRVTEAVEGGDYATAMALYAGPFLDAWHLRASVEFEEWVDRQRERLAGLYREACRGRVAECRALGDGAAALAAARSWTVDEPLEAEAQHAFITLLLESGDPLGALRQYRGYERRLHKEELDLLPETRRLLERIQLQVERTTATAAAVGGRAGARAPEVRIAVLPFEHDGSDQDRYFTQGFVDELTNELARVPGIAVTARTSAVQLPDPDLPLARIGKELRVDHLIRGAVRWNPASIPPRIRINAALVRVADGSQMWGRSYDAELADSFDVQADAIEAITAVLDLEPRASAAVGRAPSVSREGEAWELFLKAFQHANQRNERSMRTAAELYQQAVVLQPDFARAYAGLAQVYAVFPGFTPVQPREWYLRAQTTARKALELDPDLPEAHAAIAFPLLHMLDLAEAERHLDRCVELAPSYAPAWVRLGYLYCATGRPHQARDAGERALALDPLSVATNFDTGYQFWQLRDLEAAVRQFRRVQELDPSFDSAHFLLGAHSYRRGDLEGARRELSRIEGQGPLWAPVVAHLHRPDEAAAALDRMTELAPGPVHYLAVAGFYTLFGAHDQALHWLEGHARNVRGEPGRLDTGGPALFHIVRDPLFDPLRSDERFRRLLHRMGLDGGQPVPSDDTGAADTLLTAAESRMMRSS